MGYVAFYVICPRASSKYVTPLLKRDCYIHVHVYVVCKSLEIRYELSLTSLSPSVPTDRGIIHRESKKNLGLSSTVAWSNIIRFQLVEMFLK